MKILLIITFSFLFLKLTAQSEISKIELTQLVGKWHIHFTNFPRWLKGNRKQPTFNYALQQKGKTVGLRDEVMALKKGKSESIIGFDTPLDSLNRSFVWRGKGLLSLLKSRWKIVYFDAANQLAIIHFGKTIFTPEGFDVIAKSQKLNPMQLQIIENQLNTLKIEKRLTRLKL